MKSMPSNFFCGINFTVEPNAAVYTTILFIIICYLYISKPKTKVLCTFLPRKRAVMKSVNDESEKYM
jgi:hypothetical protein